MGRSKKAVIASVAPAAPDHLTIELFAPEMSLLHRAGLGGLACTLRAMERQYRAGLLRADRLPAPFVDDEPPWKIDDQTITLKFGRPENAGAYLKNIFAFGLQIRDGLIFLPGQYPDPPPSLAVRAEMQLALTRTLLQGAKKNVGLEPPIPYFVDPDGSGSGIIQIEYQRCQWYVQQRIWVALIDAHSSTLLRVPIKKPDGRNLNIGSIYPGAIKRHEVHDKSDVSESIKGLLSAAFFLVGCSATRHSHSGDGVLLIPEVTNLREFASERPYLTPRTVADVRVGGTADAAFQAEVRLRSRYFFLDSSLPACHAIRFSLRTWTKPQKSRIDSTEVTVEDRAITADINATSEWRSLDKFEVALAELPARIRVRATAKPVGPANSRQQEEYIWIDSSIRPLIAANLAAGRFWYDQFERLYRDKKTLNRTSYETKGLRAMAMNRTLTDEQEAAFIAAIHRAIFMTRGRIYADTMGRDAAIRRIPADAATLKRWERFMERLRLGLVQAKTASQVQSVINELLARNGTIQELRDTQVLHLVRRMVFNNQDWLRARNLTLFAVASYQRPAGEELIPGETAPKEKNSESEQPPEGAM